MGKPGIRSMAWGGAGLAVALVCLAAAPQAAQKGTAYSPPAKGLEVTFATERDGKVDRNQAAVVQRVTAVKGGETRFTEWVKSGGLIISQKHRRLRSLFSFRVNRHNGIILHDFDKAKLRGLWPLAKGKSALVKSTLYFGPEKTIAEAKAKLRRGRSLTYRYAVERIETAKLPAGAFRTYVIRRTWEHRSADGAVRETGVDRIWLATQIGWIVRQERRITGGPRKGSRQILVAIKVKRPR
jgi:hypothetical protein